MTVRGADRRLYWILAAALFISYAYFYQAGGWNQNSRFALVRAILEHHTLQIDAYRESTGDRAVSNGHYYSDKAPGLSLAALIPADAARAAGILVGTSPESEGGIAWTSYVATVATAGVFTTLAALAIAWVSLFWGYSRGAATSAALAYGLATPAWCYATLFMGHAMAAGCLTVAFAAAVALDPASGFRRDRSAWAIGLFSGGAVLAEFPAAVPVALIVGLAVLTARRNDPRSVAGVVVRVFAGGAVFAFVLCAYNAAAFGSPFHLGYASEEGFAALHTGLFGITYPAWWRVREILVGAYRGLLPVSPVIALTPIGLFHLAQDDRRIRAAAVCAAIAIFYVLLNASYYYWDGGWAFGARHVTPALPFLALGLAPLWDEWRGAGRSALLAAAAWGAAVMLMTVSTTPQPPASIARPLPDLIVPAFRGGHLSLNPQRFDDYRADEGAIERYYGPRAGWNLGMKLGLDGLASLVPLAVIWIVAASWIIFGAGRSPAASAAARTSAVGRSGSPGST